MIMHAVKVCRQVGDLHYERVEDYDLEILYELLG